MYRRAAERTVGQMHKRSVGRTDERSDGRKNFRANTRIVARTKERSSYRSESRSGGRSGGHETCNLLFGAVNSAKEVAVRTKKNMERSDNVGSADDVGAAAKKQKTGHSSASTGAHDATGTNAAPSDPKPPAKSPTTELEDE